MKIRITKCILASLAFVGGLGARGDVTGAPQEPPRTERLFSVSVQDDDGVEYEGKATAVLAAGGLVDPASGETYNRYDLTRTVGGLSSLFTSGTAKVYSHPRLRIVIELDATKPSAVETSGFLGRIDSPSSASSAFEPEAALAPIAEGHSKIVLQATQLKDYVYAGTWTLAPHRFVETWSETSELTSKIEIISPTDAAPVGPVVPFHVAVKDAIAVVLDVDGYVVPTKTMRFEGPGDEKFERRIFEPGWRRLVARGYDRTGKLVGRAETRFLASGLLLTPSEGTVLESANTRLSAVPVGIDDPAIATMSLRVDGAEKARIHVAPWGIDANLGETGKHAIEVVAWGHDGKELARTRSEVEVRHASDPPVKTTSGASTLPGLKGWKEPPFVPARYFSSRRGHPIRYIIIHKAENSGAPRFDGSATANYMHDLSDGRQVSAHYCVGARGVTQMVRDQDNAWQAGSSLYNEEGIGIEQDGFTTTPESDAQYENLARLVWHLATVHGLTAALDKEIATGHRSHVHEYQVVIGHWDVPYGSGWGGKGGHTDPEGPEGHGFDWGHFMAILKQVRDANR